jgi:transcriptional regulator with XRE-family HTH domain
MSKKNEQINDLILYRERLGFTQQHVAMLLGKSSPTVVSKIEQGHRLPSFVTALKLAIIYRVPVDFLYSGLYSEHRKLIRAREAKLSTAGKQKQPYLPLP